VCVPSFKNFVLYLNPDSENIIHHVDSKLKFIIEGNIIGNEVRKYVQVQIGSPFSVNYTP